MNSLFFRSLQLILAILDFLALNLIFFLAEIFFRKQMLVTPSIEYVYFIFFLNVVWITLSLMKNIYSIQYIASFEAFSKVTVKTYVWLILIMVIGLFFMRWMMLSRIFTVVVLAGTGAALLLNRFLYLAVQQYFKKSDWLINKVMIIGYNTLSKKLVDYLSTDTINKKIVGFCDEYENVHELSSHPILCSISEAFSVCKQHGITEIYSTIAPEHNETLYELIQTADENCIRFKIVPDLGFFFKKQMHIDYLHEIPVISLRREPLEDLSNRIKKRIFDMAVSSVAVIFILSWLIPVIGLLIKLESKGPLFFTQKRTGKNNRNFYCLKFRSMYKNKDADSTQATMNDGRVTRLGKFLRRTSLDEFPQFINVLRGDMSIVGPRPHMLKHTDEYSKLIGQYMVRQFIKPGITGWAQINGFRGETKIVEQMKKRVEHDLWYLENWSLFLDLKIMITTIVNTAQGNQNVF